MHKPALYAKSNALPRKVVEDLLNEFVDESCKKSARCIDVGSGPGDLVVDLLLPKLNPEAEVVCSDISEKMVNFAREKYGSNKRMSFINLDIASPDLPQDLTGQFDLVTSTYCLHFCREMRQPFTNMFNLLRPGGTALVSFISKSPAMNGLINLAAMPQYQPYMKDVDSYITIFQHTEKPLEVLEPMLKEIGFDVQHCSVREKSWIFDTLQDFGDLMLAVNPFVDRMPAEIRKNYEKDLARATAKENIIFNKHHENEDEYSVLFLQHVLVIYLKKPLTC